MLWYPALYIWNRKGKPVSPDDTSHNTLLISQAFKQVPLTFRRSTIKILRHSFRFFFSCILTFSSFDVVPMWTVLGREFSWFARVSLLQRGHNASAKIAFDGSFEQCPSFVSHPFLNMISFLSASPPGYSKWTSFAHRTTLQNVPNIAKRIFISDPWSRIPGVNVVFWQRCWFEAPATQYIFSKCFKQTSPPASVASIKGWPFCPLFKVWHCPKPKLAKDVKFLGAHDFPLMTQDLNIELGSSMSFTSWLKSLR